MDIIHGIHTCEGLIPSIVSPLLYSIVTFSEGGKK